MKIGIRAHDVVEKSSAPLLVRNLKELGIENIQLVFKKAFSDMPFTEENAISVSKVFKENGIHVAMLGAYFNPVHSNKELVRKNTEYFKEHLKYAHILDAEYVGTETGSYNDDKWTYHPKNRTEEGYRETMAIFHELKDCAEKYGKTILMEPAFGHVIHSVDCLKRAVDELDSRNVKVTIDLYNLLSAENHVQYKDIFHHAMETFRNDIKVIHLKDFYIENGNLVQTGLGKGTIDFSYIVEKAMEYAPDATMVFEGVRGDDIRDSLVLIRGLLSRYQ